MKLGRLAFILAWPFLLVSCLLTPGKFVSTLDIRADRSFAFTYTGEAIALENGMDASESCDDSDDKAACEAKAAETKRQKAAQEEQKLKEVATALEREAGYRSVQYLGNRKFRVDYQISGKLDRAFLFPFNADARAVFPWLAIELRKDGTARMTAPGFGEEDTSAAAGPMGPMGKGDSAHDGTFTLTTDAEIVMQNEESGAQAGSSGAKKIVWRVTPTSKTVPTAVLRFRS